MDPISLFLIVLVAVIAYFFFSRFTKKGKQRLESKKREKVEVFDRLVARGYSPRSLASKRKIEMYVSLVFFVICVVLLGLIFEFAPGLGSNWSLEEISIFALLTLPVLGLVLLSSRLASVIGDRAERSGRSWLAFYVVSYFVSPLITGLFAIALKDEALSGGKTNQESGSQSLESKLVEIQNLREKGLISEADFEAKKKDVLGI
jgi:hypothetical protein